VTGPDAVVMQSTCTAEVPYNVKSEYKIDRAEDTPTTTKMAATHFFLILVAYSFDR